MASEPPPPYTRPNHNLAFASSEEKLGALKEWAESKKYVTPGTDGPLPAMDRGGYGLWSLVWGGPLETGPGPATIPESPATEAGGPRKTRRSQGEGGGKEEAPKAIVRTENEEACTGEEKRGREGGSHQVIRPRS